MPEWILFLPILIPVAGALLVALLARLAPHASRWVTAGLFVAEIVALLVNIAPIEHRMVISEWKIANYSLAFEFDGIALILLVTMFVVPAALRLITWSNTAQRTLDPFALLVLATAATLTLAASLPAIYSALVLFDIAFFCWRVARDIERNEALRSLAVGLIGDLALFAGAQFVDTTYINWSSALIGLAFWARLGLFPFHWLYPLRGTDSRDLWTARGVPLLASANLWLRWPAMELNAPASLVGILTLLALAASAFWVWREEQPSRVAIAGVWHGVALIPLAVAFGQLAGIALALWMTLGVAFALALMEMALRWRAENRNHWPKFLWVLAILSLAGIPLTPVFVGRIGLYAAMWNTGNGWFLLYALVLTVVILVPLWRYGLALQGSESRDPTPLEAVGLVALILPFVALGFAPMPIAQALGHDAAASANAALALGAASNTLAIVAAAAIVLLGCIASLFLRRTAHYFRPQANSLPLRVARLADLDWLERVVTGVGFEMGAAARNLSALAEENPAVWILLIALWVAIFVLIPR